MNQIIAQVLRKRLNYGQGVGSLNLALEPLLHSGDFPYIGESVPHRHFLTAA
jgi:hypothetical protein